MEESQFQQRFGGYCAKHERLWTHAPTDPDWGPVISLSEKIEREEQASRWAEKFEALARRYPASPEGREVWKWELLSAAREVAITSLGFSRSSVELMFTGLAMDATELFLKQAKAFDPGLTDEDLFQAIRNLWVFHALQILLGKSPGPSQAAFAYSLLYPCTDNCLDDPVLSGAAKRQFCAWLDGRLRGDRRTRPNARAEQVDHLIARIEDCYPRQTFPQVHLSLRAIHRAQICSLAQQDALHPLRPEELLRVTLAKGGSSVLVDGYLVHGSLSEVQAEFAFGYGVLLQILDDLQDLWADTANGHTTLVTRAAAAGELETLMKRLWAFARQVLAANPVLETPQSLSLKSLIEANCRLVLLHAVATNREHLGPSFLRQVEAASPFRLEYLDARENALRGQYKTVLKTLRRRGNRLLGPARLHSRVAQHLCCNTARH